MAFDLSTLDGYKSVVDQQQLQDAFELKKALAGAELQKALKPDPLDVTKMGQAVLVKKQMGLPTTPQEDAIANVYNASTQSLFQDFQGNIINKPGVMDRLGGNSGQPNTSPTTPSGNFSSGMRPVAPGTGSGGDFLNDVAPTGAPTPAPSINPWDAQYQQQRDKLLAAGDRMAAHQLDVDYAKAKINMNEQQSNAATYADRMNLSEPILNDPNKIAAYSDPSQVARAKYAPLTSMFGNYLNNDNYNSFDQAQKDFITAKLRKESGAAINAGEFATDEKTFLPRASDSPEVVAQKKAAREAIRGGLARAAGPAYEPTVVNAPAPAAPQVVIPQSAAAHLRSNPQLRDQFDAKYGAGASKLVLGN